ncbi:MAG: GNAT family N-acetyltransferase [Rubrobacteraceae bacterium]
MVCEACTFETDRLSVDEWHSSTLDDEELARVVANLLTGPVTRSLPVSWRGRYTEDRARTWIEERDNEGTTLLVVERSTDRAIGLIILFETDPGSAPDGIEVRIGYLLSETVWGRGYATELVRGFVGWCRGQPSIHSLAGGVERGNAASARVLEKNGFHAVPGDEEVGSDEQVFRLILRP